MRAFAIRDEKRGHGLGGRLAGPVEIGDAAVIMAAAVEGAGEIEDALEAVREEGLEVTGIVVLADLSGGAAEAAASANEAPFLALTGHSDLFAPNLGESECYDTGGGSGSRLPDGKKGTGRRFGN